MALNPGHTLSNGHYRILRLLGRGGYGFVYLAQDTLLGEEVAIKELIPALVGDEVTLKRFLAEAKATMRLTHKQIVRTYNIFSEGDNAGDSRFYIVMEYMPGGSLEERLWDRGPLPVEEAVRVAAEVCEGLACAHEEGVVHCDLKPHNILFDAGGGAKVADFGIAHVSGEMLTRSWMTPAGFVAGTLPYMSPEQTDGVRDDPRVDVYAVGAVLYRMLTGQTYLDFDPRETPRSQADNVQRIFDEQPLPPSAHRRGIPAWLDRVVLKALAKRPEARYADAEAMGAALRQRRPDAPAPRLSAARAAPSPTPTPARAVPSGRERALLPRWFWPVAGAAGVLLVVLIIITGVLLGAGDGRETLPPRTELQSPLPIATPTTIHPEIPEPTATLASTSIDTPQPTPTNGFFVPAITLSPLPTSTSLVPAITLSPLPTTAPQVPVPTLVDPRPDLDVRGRVLFRWQYSRSLGASEAFQVLIWRDGSLDHQGAAQFTAQSEQQIDLDILLGERGGPGDYWWSVVVVDERTEARISDEADPRRFNYLGEQLPTPILQAGATRVRGSDGSVMVYVPAGGFSMGSSDADIDAVLAECSDCTRDRFRDEQPQHAVYLDAFWIDKTEVTNAQYRICVEAGSCQTPTGCVWGEPTYDDSTKADHPVVCVSWDDARAYCQWAGGRLPTEAEWEKAARGTEGRIYPWGNTFDGSKVNYCDRSCELDTKDTAANDGSARTAPVGSYSAGASPYGALDMAGNAWEWVADRYDSGYYASSPANNPKGPNSGDRRVLRGGSWSDVWHYVRAAHRLDRLPTLRDSDLGFRCAASPGE